MSITRTSHSSSIKQTNKKQPKRTGIIAFCLPPKMGHFNAKMTQQHNVLKSKLLYICERSCLSKDIYVYYFIFILRAICHQYLSSSAKCIKIKKKNNRQRKILQKSCKLLSKFTLLFSPNKTIASDLVTFLPLWATGLQVLFLPMSQWQNTLAVRWRPAARYHETHGNSNLIILCNDFMFSLEMFDCKS